MNLSVKANQMIPKLIVHVETVVVGKRNIVKLIMTAMLVGDHALIEDVLGVGKTVLSRVILKLIDADFKRIQLKFDLLLFGIFNLKSDLEVWSNDTPFKNMA